MIVFYSLVGVVIFIGVKWFRWSNAVDKGKADPSWGNWLWDQRQEFISGLGGAIIFMMVGQGLMDSASEVVGFFWGEKAEKLAISIIINIEEGIWIAGGAKFTTVLVYLAKYSKKKADKKLEEI